MRSLILSLGSARQPPSPPPPLSLRRRTPAPNVTAMRMIFDDRAGVLHILSDDDKSFFDITKANAASADPTGMMGEMQKQLEKMPKEQRAQAEMMMKGMMGTTAPQPPLTYVWTTDTKEIAGYECTLVEGMRGDNKVTEYCGSKSNVSR